MTIREQIIKKLNVPTVRVLQEILMSIRENSLSDEEKRKIYNFLIENCMSPEADFLLSTPFTHDQMIEIGYWVGLNESSGIFGEVSHWSNGSNEGYWAGLEANSDQG